MKTIGVFFGSRSPEHDVSIITGQLIIAELKKLGHQVVPVYITKKGEWLIDEKLGSIKIFSNPSLALPSKGEGKWFLDLENSVGKMAFKKKGLTGKSVVIDLAFPALHGSNGEDGTIQGLFEMLGVPFVGCDVASSAIAMDKALTKIVLRDSGIPTSKFIYFTKSEWETEKPNVLKQIESLNWPVFVKPVHLGSSIAIGKGKNRNIQDLEMKIEVALHYDDKVLVEEAVNNLMDVTCCVTGNENLTASELQESIFGADLFDFEEKYLKEGGAQLGNAKSGVVIPARLDAQITSEIKETAKQVYKVLGCSGIARVDFLYDKSSKKFYVSEVNPLPGTLYHHLWKASGKEISQLIKELLHLAEEKHSKKQKIAHTFESGILKQLSSQKLNSKKLQ